MIRNLVEAKFLPRFGLTFGAYLFWAAVFLTLINTDVAGAHVLLAMPVFVASILFGVRGAIAGSVIGLLAYGGLNVVAGTDTFGILIRGGNIFSVAIMISLALVAGHVRRIPQQQPTEVEPDADIEHWVDMHQVEQRREQMYAIAAEFNSLAHKSPEIADVARCVISHVSRALHPDSVAVAFADQENREVTVEQAVGTKLMGFSAGDGRSVREALADPLTELGLMVLNAEELVAMSADSHFAATATENGIKSALVSTLRNDEDLVTQIWICSSNESQYSDLDVEFIAQISDHLKSAAINARNSESLKQLQRHLVGQNEMFAQMQDGIEGNEGELRLSNEQLTELSDSKTQFMSEVAHEIKSPLAVMIGYADLLRFDAVNLGSDQREYATAIEKSARQLAVLIDDLSDITNIESGHFTTAKEPHNVMKVISSVTDGLKVSDPDIDRRLTVSDSLFDFEVEGDPARLSQVFTNLISNALKYSDGDQPVEVSTVKTENNSVRISIIDRGLGIAEEDVEKLFTPYFRSMNPEATQRPGTGLGLFLSRSIIEQHGGTLTLSTQVGIGSTFTVELPSSLNTPLADAA
ncbi:MAG: hypothetical protein HOJ22_08290 [Chloroflexi bacterium]|jgi:signal transduction histidine kinase|nr:hypothetical protein [Chloroflexota bacterium]MBT5628276.1 hypothetical protein [Chloroflexota bacterium]